MTDNTAIQELLTGVIKWKTFHFYCGTLFANMFEEIRGLFFGMHGFLIRQFSYDGTINRFNRLSIHNKTFSASKNSCSSLSYLDKLLLVFLIELGFKGHHMGCILV